MMSTHDNAGATCAECPAISIIERRSVLSFCDVSLFKVQGFRVQGSGLYLTQRRKVAKKENFNNSLFNIQHSIFVFVFCFSSSLQPPAHTSSLRCSQQRRWIINSVQH